MNPAEAWIKSGLFKEWVMESELESLLTEFANAHFACGAHKDGDAEEYDELFTRTEEAKKAIFKYLNYI